MKKLLLSFLFLINIYPQWISSPIINNPISTTTETEKTPQMITDGKAGAIVLFYASRGGVSTICGQRILKDGTLQWGPIGKVIISNTGNITAPRAIPDGLGGAFLTWTDFRNPVNDSDIYVQHIDSNGNSLWQPDGILITNLNSAQANPAIVSDSAGGIIVVWEDGRATGEVDIFGQRIMSNGSIAWTLDGVALCTYQGKKTNIQAVADGAGGAVLVWQDFGDDAAGDIYAQSVTSLGKLNWEIFGRLVTNSANEQSRPLIVKSPTEVYYVWQDFRNDSTVGEIYVQKVLYSTSTDLFATTGKSLVLEGSNKMLDAISLDQSNNLILVYNNFGSKQLSIAKFNLICDPLWPPQAVTTNDTSFSQASIIMDSLSQPTVVWMDSRTGDKNIYAQKFDVNGLNFWTPDGVVISNAPGDQIQPVAVKSEKNVIIAWQDFRANISSADIYASMLSDLGNLTPVELTSFSAAQIDNAVKIDFTTATEKNCKGFEVEKSANDIDWKGIGFIKGAGSSTDKNNYSFLDYDIKSNQTYYFRLKQIDNDGTENFSEEITLRTGNIANSFALSDNYPNPFNPSTTIEFNVPVRTFVQLNVYDVLGNLVNAVVNEVKESGNYKLKIDGSKLSSGVYYYQIKAGNFLQTKKMILLK